MTADVSFEALKIMKTALAKFQADMTGLSGRVSAEAQNVAGQCQGWLSQAEALVRESEAAIAELNKEIESLDEDISKAEKEVHALISRIDWLKKRVDTLEMEIHSLELQQGDLRARMAWAENQEDREYFSGKIGILEGKMSKTRFDLDNAKRELADSEDRKARLWKTIDNLKKRRAEKEDMRVKEKSRCERRKDKLSRLRDAMYQVEAELGAYLGAVKKFEGQSGDRARRNTGAIEKCIASIEAYLSTNL